MSSAALSRWVIAVVGAAVLAGVAWFVGSHVPFRVWIGLGGVVVVSAGLAAWQFLTWHNGGTGLDQLQWLARLMLLSWLAGVATWIAMRFVEAFGSNRHSILVDWLLPIAAFLLPAGLLVVLPLAGQGDADIWLAVPLGILSILVMAVVPSWLTLVVVSQSVTLAVLLHDGRVILFFLVSCAGAIVIRIIIANLVAGGSTGRAALTREFIVPTVTAPEEQAGIFFETTSRAAFLGSAILACGVLVTVSWTTKPEPVHANPPDTRGIARAELEQHFMPILHVASDNPGPSSPCSYVNPNDATTANSQTDCAPEALLGTSGPSKLASSVYVYAVILTGLPHSRTTTHLPSSARGTTLIVDYWMFYDTDDWTAQTALGPIEQGHDGDWEHVLIGFTGGSNDESLYTPRWIAYSSHCGGSWLPWAAAPRDGDRPKVFVAKGSHANYPSRSVQTPNWASCVNGTLDRLSSVASLSLQITEELPDDLETRDYTLVQDSDARPFLMTLHSLGQGDWYTVDGWTTKHELQPDPDSLHGVPSPLDPTRAVSRSPLDEIFGRNTKWHCAAPAKICPDPANESDGAAASS
jgi:hypothetical protein